MSAVLRNAIDCSPGQRTGTSTCSKIKPVARRLPTTAMCRQGGGDRETGFRRPISSALLAIWCDESGAMPSARLLLAIQVVAVVALIAGLWFLRAAAVHEFSDRAQTFRTLTPTFRVDEIQSAGAQTHGGDFMEEPTAPAWPNAPSNGSADPPVCTTAVPEPAN